MAERVGAPSRPSSAETPSLRLVSAHIARVALRVAYAPMKLLPTKRKVVMMSREHDSIPSDFDDLRLAIERADPSVEVVMLARVVGDGPVEKVKYGAHLLRCMYHAATSRVLVVDTYSFVASLLTHKRDLTVVQIWHAIGALKKFGLSILGQSEGRDERMARALRMHHGYDVVLASSEAARLPYAEALGVDPEDVRILPLPRVDRVRDPERRRLARESVYAAHPELRGTRVALYAPTFRMNGQVPVDLGELRERLAAIGLHLVVKPHPLAPDRAEVDVTPDFSTLELLSVADVFVTDYSTTIAEAALCAVPSYILAPDLDDYLDARGFYFDFVEGMPGPVVRDVESLVRAVAASAATIEGAESFARRWVEIPGESEPRPGDAPCADEIAALVLAHVSRASADESNANGLSR